MKRIASIVLLLFLVISLYPQEKRLALVIGNSDYQYGGKLDNPVNDARSMDQVLKAVGFDVIKYEDLDQKMMRQAIDNFGNLLTNYDIGLFFFAGHGVQAKGFNYLIPVDATLSSEGDVEYNCVRADRVLGKMESAETKTNIVILDACRNNPFERSWTRSPTGKGLAFMSAPTGSLVAYATSPGETASDGTGGNGLYTSGLLTYMVEPNITVLEMFQKVRTLVREKSDGNQVPWESTSLEGNFYFQITSYNLNNQFDTEIKNTQNIKTDKLIVKNEDALVEQFFPGYSVVEIDENDKQLFKIKNGVKLILIDSIYSGNVPIPSPSIITRINFKRIASIREFNVSLVNHLLANDPEMYIVLIDPSGKKKRLSLLFLKF